LGIINYSTLILFFIFRSFRNLSFVRRHKPCLFCVRYRLALLFLYATLVFILLGYQFYGTRQIPVKCTIFWFSKPIYFCTA